MQSDDDGQVRQVEGVRSTAALGGHPIHPMLVPFPMAFLTAALGTDIAYLRTRDPFWARASEWLLRAGVVSGAAAAVFGAADWTTIRHARSNAAGIVHAAGNTAALGLAYANLSRRRGRRESAVADGGAALSAAVAGILGVTGWAGGELSYRHGIGVAGHERSRRRTRGLRAEGPHVRYGRATGEPVEGVHPRFGRAGLEGAYDAQIRRR
ncbi:DUF2231 domain-containing protein [Arenibaculum sp.]|jgi:uncharacterized membrane protein|uniref:DUF2231 domain-containing protein n=1 Tax=Arenibaculum sp. TaxID=2865862 RepID=UPI002E0ED339|nr:DUF2231 domain-containing protein [Arenibaculum sp.]